MWSERHSSGTEPGVRGSLPVKGRRATMAKVMILTTVRMKRVAVVAKVRAKKKDLTSLCPR